MKILVVGNYFYPEHTGGVEIVSYNLVKYYREFGCDVCWMAADVRPRFRVVGDKDLPIRSWNFAEEKLGFPSPVPGFSEFTKMVKGVKLSDVIHLQDCLYPINIFVFFVAKLMRKPVLITQYAKFIPYSQFYKRILQVAAYYTVGRLMFTFADRVAFITKNVLDNMRHLNPKKLSDVIPLGVDTDFYSPIADEERRRIRSEISGNPDIPIILFVGRMVERKGVHLIRPLVEKYREWRWVFVGRSDDYNPTEWQFSNLTYYPNASEQKLKELYASSDLLVHPSIGEGITLVVSESLASGTPVVISKESLYDLSEKDRDLFFAVEPTLSDIEEKINYALSNKQRLEELRSMCRNYALSWLSWKKMVMRYLEILDDMVV